MRVFWTIICGGYWILLTALLLAPRPESVLGMRRVPFDFPFEDKVVHFTSFMLLCLFVHVVRWPGRSSFWLMGSLIVYGLATECLQYFFPPRSPDPWDFLADAFGVLAGAGVYWAVRRRFGPKPVPHLAAELVRQP